jgi:hypothetical protein
VRPNEADIKGPDREDDQGDAAVVVATDIEYIPVIPYCVHGAEIPLQFMEVAPVCLLNEPSKVVQGICCVSIFLQNSLSAVREISTINQPVQNQFIVSQSYKEAFRDSKLNLDS